MPAGASLSSRAIAPRQERSRATLERICRAAAELLEEKSWAEVTIAEIVARARSSVGSFYARFADKDALLDLLDERYTVSVLELADRMAIWVGTEAPDLEEYVRTLVGELVTFHRRSAGLIRALVLRARIGREPAYDERTRRMQAAVCEVFEPLLERMPEGGAAEPEARAVERCFFAFTFMFSALRDRILFPESIVEPAELTDEALAEHLTAATLAYLRTPSMETDR